MQISAECQPWNEFPTLSLMMEVEAVSEMLGTYSIFTQLIAREDFIIFMSLSVPAETSLHYFENDNFNETDTPV
jgi:aminoglycoside N3'-acetyltransferase